MSEQSETAKGQEKRRRILEAARAAFLADGFHATSMQDLFRATDTSPGAFYRYFPGKDSLIHALANEAIARLSETIGAAIAADPPRLSDALAPAFSAIDAMEQAHGTARLALMIWAETQRSVAMAQLFQEAVRPMLAAIDKLAGTLIERGIVAADRQHTEVATALAGILQGYVVHRALFGTRADTYRAGLDALTQIA